MRRRMGFDDIPSDEPGCSWLRASEGAFLRMLFCVGGPCQREVSFNIAPNPPRWSRLLLRLRRRNLVNIPPRQIPIRVDSPIAQKRPVCAAELDFLQIAGNDEHMLL